MRAKRRQRRQFKWQPSAAEREALRALIAHHTNPRHAATTAGFVVVARFERDDSASPHPHRLGEP